MRSLVILAVALLLLLVVAFAAWVLIEEWSVKRQEDHPAPDALEAAADDPGAEWQAEVKLQQLSERNPDYEANRLTVVLRNAKGNEIETPEVQFELNGVPLRYLVGQGNYYDRHPYYRLNEDSVFTFVADAPYELAVRRGGAPASPFARIRTPKHISPDEFRIPATHPRNRDLVIFWADLSQSADLLVYKTLSFTDESGNRAILEGGPYGDEVLRQHIGSGGMPLSEGRYTIPVAYLATSAGRSVTSIGIEITSLNNGKFLHPVLKRSIVTAERKIVQRVDVVEP